MSSSDSSIFSMLLRNFGNCDGPSYPTIAARFLNSIPMCLRLLPSSASFSSLFMARRAVYMSFLAS